MKLATDIGGTFTDLVYLDEATGDYFLAKSLSTPPHFSQGIMDAIHKSELDPAGVTGFVHGATIVINALTERKGARTALIVTEGFRDSIEIAFEHRFEQYDIFMRKPPPLVPREWRFGVPERMDGRGNVLIPLDEAAVRALAPKLKAEGIEAIAVGYMHAYLDGKHERRTRDILG